MQTVDLTQWHDRTEEPVIVWVYAGFTDMFPTAVDDTHGHDLYQEYASAFYATRAYQTAEELEEDSEFYDLTPAQVWNLYSLADGSADRAGLPLEIYVEGVNQDGSDATIYVDQEVFFYANRATLAEAAASIDPDDLAEIRDEIAAARKEYDC